MRIYFFITAAVLLLGSCYSTRDLNYVQSDQYSSSKVTAFHNKRFIYEVQPNDILSIRVQSLDPEQSAFFNIENVGGGVMFGAEASMFMSGYSVDEKGYINLPIVGQMKVSSLTVDEIQRLIQKEINKYLLDAIVLVKLVSYKVSILGDVRNHGLYFIYNTKATIFEALSMAGDLNLTSNSTNVKLIRQIEDSGYVEVLDLTDPKILVSPYYYMLPNDVIYVEIAKEQTVRQNLPILGTFFTGLTTLILILNYLDNYNRN